MVTTPQGQVQIEFAEPNDYGVLDHTVYLSEENAIRVPMRVISNAAGSEVLFTLFKRPGMSDAMFEDDAEMVMRDLQTLREVLEHG